MPNIDTEQPDVPDKLPEDRKTEDSSEKMTTSRWTRLKQRMARPDINLGILVVMLKGALPPTIALAGYQSDWWASEFTTLGYISAIMSVLSLPVLPQAKFVQSMCIIVPATCLAAAISLLQIRCAVSARSFSPPLSSTTPGSPTAIHAVPYSAAASVTACLWLFVNIYLANVARASRPQLFLPSIQYIVFVTIASTYAPTYPNMEAGMNFINRLLKTFLMGQGLATGVTIFIIPITSRTICQKQMASVIDLLKQSLSIDGAFLRVVTNVSREPGNNEQNMAEDAEGSDGSLSINQTEAAGKKLKGLLQHASQLLGLLKVEVGFAKKEIGYGKLDAQNLSSIFQLLQQTLVPIVGMSTLLDISHVVGNHNVDLNQQVSDPAIRTTLKNLHDQEWREIIALSCQPFQTVKQALADGLTHVALAIEVATPSKARNKDVEQDAETCPVPGSPSFPSLLQATLQELQERRSTTLQQWCKQKGISVPMTFWDEFYQSKEDDLMSKAVSQRHKSQQLYLLLYVEFMLQSASRAVMNMVDFADSLTKDGTMSRKRLILPGWRRVRKLFENAFEKVDTERRDGEAIGLYVFLGDSLAGARDPEHLLPRNRYQKATNKLRSISAFLSSEESAYGFRTAVASISLAILAYIRETSQFYLSQRGIWAVIMVSISMGPHVGAGVQGFFTRAAGTVVATVMSIAIWYMADQKPAAILPLSYLYFVVCLYFLLKKPKHLITAALSIVTYVLIIGYEMEDQKIGTRLLEKNRQQYHPIYLLAPYRLITVLAGLGAAFFWTYFPYPITTHSTLRKDLGATLYLLAKYHSSTHSTIEARLRHSHNTDFNTNKSHPLHKLHKARIELFEKITAMLGRLREQSAFTVYEPSLGGKFPKQTYDELIEHMQNLFNYTALIASSSESFETELSHDTNGRPTQWLDDFRRISALITLTSHDITSTLCLLSASIYNARPLPPYMTLPQPPDIATQISRMDAEILDVRNMDQPCYSAFAVLEVAGVLVSREMEAIAELVKGLVGEVDFSVRVGDGSELTGEAGRGGRKGKAE